MQHVHYNEFLSVLLGKEMSEKLDILSQPNVVEDHYDPTVDPSIANSFAAAAFRFAHTLLPGLMRMTRDTTSPEAVRLHAMLFNPFSLYKAHGLNNAIKMAVYTPLQKSDALFTTELTENLFVRGDNETLDDIIPEPITPTEINMEKPPPICGLDLVSLNLQRFVFRELKIIQEQ
jgi:peroxidase